MTRPYFLPVVLFIFAFFYLLFFSRFDIIPGDEGYFNLACFRILRGELPYRDFFLHTPPLSYFIQSAIFKVFGEDLIVGRLTMVFVGVFICVLLYMISSQLAGPPFSLIPSLLFVFWGVSHIPYPIFNWYGLFMGLLVILFIFRFTDSRHSGNLLAAGFFAGCLALIKQNLGAAALISLVVYLAVLRANNIKLLIKDYSITAIGVFLTVSPVVLFFYASKSLKQLVFYLFNFSRESLTMRMELIPFPHLKIASFIILITFFWVGFLLYNATIKKRYKVWLIASLSVIALGSASYRFMRQDLVSYIDDHMREGIVNGFFNLPALAIIMAFLFLTRKAIKGQLEKNDFRLGCIAIFSLLYIWFGIILSRDLIHLIPTMPAAYPLYAFFSKRLYDRYNLKMGGDKRPLTGYLFVLPLAFFCLYGFVMNMNNETFRSSSGKIFDMKYHMKANRAKFLVVDSYKGLTIEKLVEYIGSNTEPRDKIFLFWVDSTPYILADRMPAAFNTLFIPDAFRLRDQRRVIDDIISNDPKFIICDYEPSLTAKSFQRGEATKEIEEFIHRNYAVREKIGPYYVLTRQQTPYQ